MRRNIQGSTRCSRAILRHTESLKRTRSLVVAKALKEPRMRLSALHKVPFTAEAGKLFFACRPGWHLSYSIHSTHPPSPPSPARLIHSCSTRTNQDSNASRNPHCSATGRLSASARRAAASHLDTAACRIYQLGLGLAPELQAPMSRRMRQAISLALCEQRKRRQCAQGVIISSNSRFARPVAFSCAPCLCCTAADDTADDQIYRLRSECDPPGACYTEDKQIITKSPPAPTTPRRRSAAPYDFWAS